MPRRILVVEDNAGLAQLICDNLTVDGFAVASAATASDALSRAASFVPDLILLDLMLPDQSGFELLGALRRGARTPVIIVSVRAQRTDKVQGLRLGADDYLTKPFDMAELTARINAVLRRAVPPVERITLGDITVDFVRLQATVSGRDVQLTYREFEILRYLATHRDRVVLRDQLLIDVWGLLDGSTTRSVDFAVVRLRKKIEPDPHNPKYIRTVRGDGYCLVLDS